MNGNIKGIFGVVAFIFGVIVLFFIAINFLTRSRGNVEGNLVEPVASITDYATPRSTATYTQRGRIIADENHFSWSIEITESQRSIEIRSGYEDNVVARSTYDNNQEAYEEFIYALAKTGAKGVAENTDELQKGVCARGTLSTFNLREGSDVVLDQWRTSCGQGTTEFNRRVQTLFQNQIPDYKDVVRGVKL